MQLVLVCQQGSSRPRAAAQGQPAERPLPPAAPRLLAPVLLLLWRPRLGQQQSAAQALPIKPAQGHSKGSSCSRSSYCLSSMPAAASVTERVAAAHSRTLSTALQQVQVQHRQQQQQQPQQQGSCLLCCSRRTILPQCQRVPMRGWSHPMLLQRQQQREVSGSTPAGRLVVLCRHGPGFCPTASFSTCCHWTRTHRALPAGLCLGACLACLCCMTRGQQGRVPAAEARRGAQAAGSAVLLPAAAVEAGLSWKWTGSVSQWIPTLLDTAKSAGWQLLWGHLRSGTAWGHQQQPPRRRLRVPAAAAAASRRPRRRLLRLRRRLRALPLLARVRGVWRRQLLARPLAGAAKTAAAARGWAHRGQQVGPAAAAASEGQGWVLVGLGRAPRCFLSGGLARRVVPASAAALQPAGQAA